MHTIKLDKIDNDKNFFKISKERLTVTIKKRLELGGSPEFDKQNNFSSP